MSRPQPPGRVEMVALVLVLVVLVVALAMTVVALVAAGDRPTSGLVAFAALLCAVVAGLVWRNWPHMRADAQEWARRRRGR